MLSCGKKQSENKDLIFFNAPTGGPLREKWIAAIKRPPGSISKKTSIHCCQEHFNVSIFQVF